MASTEPEKCFTCFRRTDKFIRITEQDGVSGEDLQEIFIKHFWFTKNQFHNKTVCTTCWERIDDFHRFYCEVEKMHTAELLAVKEELPDEVEDDLATKMEDEEEPDQGESDVFAEALCKVEHAGDASNSSHSSDEEDDEDDDDDDEDEDYVDPMDKKGSDSESEVPLAKRKATRKLQKHKKSNVRKRVPFSFSCKLCVDAGTENDEPFTTFYRLSKHFREVHKSPPFVMCCGRRYSSRRGLGHHFKKHPTMKNISKRCVECNIYFRSEHGLAKHLFLIHTPEDQKQFKCDLCLKAFADEELLRIHINWHFQVQQKDHYCAECDRYFISAINLASHNEMQHQTPLAATKPDLDDDASNDSDQSESESKVKGTPESIAKEEEIIHKILTLNCSACDVVADTFQLLKKHGRDAHGLKLMTIVCCERRFSRRSRLYEHCLFHLKPDAFECELCKKRFPDSNALQHHKWWMHTPASERPFKCDICGNKFMKEYLLKQHIQRHVEQERKVFQCQLCDRALSTASQLRAHMQSLHGEASAWVCDVCAKGFSHRSVLERHRLSHTPEGLAKMMEQCTNCNRWYSNRKSFIKHRRRCGVAQPVKCDQCDHTAVNDVALKTHQKLRHTDRPKYPCTYCGKEFSRELRLKEHEANHAGIVLYKCEFCPRMCNSSSNMYTHKKVAHPEQWAQRVAARFGPPPTVPQ
ncbi:zinc finger protein 91-like [Ochlerotatus camptorhynchus]|uniref:zinc finger protein 91-like n=1 Tax=Ochlerotatus camptorhynchus TaxID=644619 RepID=UPI0031D2E97C